MGLLDDAIREHLDLKRRRGADPAEVERLEREALGPVRREFDQPRPGSVAEGVGEEVWQEHPGEGGWEPRDEEREWAPGSSDPGAPTELHSAAPGFDAPAGEFETGPSGHRRPAPEFLQDEDEDADAEDFGSMRPVSFQPRSLRDRFRRGSKQQPQDEPAYEEDDDYEDDLYEEESYAEERFTAPRAGRYDESGRAPDEPGWAPDEPGRAPDEPRGAADEPRRASDEPGRAPGTGGHDPRLHAGQETVEYDALGGGPEPELEFEEGVRRVPRAPAAPEPAAPEPGASDPERPSRPGAPDPDRPAAPPPVSGAPVERQADYQAPPRAGEPAEDEDVLEETPEFLHDTPEHDRLWFEQRPPRDFDFDG